MRAAINDTTTKKMNAPATFDAAQLDEFVHGLIHRHKTPNQETRPTAQWPSHRLRTLIYISRASATLSNRANSPRQVR
jgi:hypothetical protein